MLRCAVSEKRCCAPVLFYVKRNIRRKDYNGIRQCLYTLNHTLNLTLNHTLNLTLNHTLNLNLTLNLTLADTPYPPLPCPHREIQLTDAADRYS